MTTVILTFAGRAGLGVLLALTLSMMGTGIAWGLYVFSGAVSRTTLEAMFIAGAGIGAGLGGSLAWLRIQGNPRSILIPTMLVTLLAGVGGAWAGYDYGSNREIECCAKPAIGIFSYAAFGATLAANAEVLLLSIAREIITRRRFDSNQGGLEI